MKYYIAVKGIIEKDEKILIVKRSDKESHRPSVWETVGGRMDHVIAPEEELKREISEETGLIVDVLNPLTVFSFVEDTGEFFIGITYVCKYISGKVVLSEEHTDYRWIDPVNFADFDLVNSLRCEIARYVDKHIS